MSTNEQELIRHSLDLLGAKFLIRGWLSSNNIVFAEQTEVTTVVDTGYSTHAEQTRLLIQRALRGKNLNHIVNTHLHSDHCGGNSELLRQWPAAQIRVPKGYANSLCPWNEDLLSFRDCDQRCQPFPAHAWLDAGTEVQLGSHRWQIHGTGGHDPDAVVLFEPQSATLISGDALWQERLAIIFPELQGRNGFDEAAAALDLIEHLSPRVVLPGHGQAFTGVTQALKASRSRLETFSAEPNKHRQHATRALLMYHMLEYQSRDRRDLLAWMVRTPIFNQAMRCQGNNDLALQLATETLQRMISDGVLAQHGEAITIKG